MEELTEVITAAEFHPTACHLFVYSSSKGTIRLCDMRSQAICDKHTKCECVSGFMLTLYAVHLSFLSFPNQWCEWIRVFL